MALTATIFSFDVELAHIDRGVYESLSFRAAQHPSEAADHLLTRVLAYCLEYTPGIEFSKGLSTADEPAIFVRDATGTLTTWIDIGTPSAERLHKAAKAVSRVVVYCHKDPDRVVRELASARVHRREAIELFAVDRDLVAALVERLTRRLAMTLSASEDQLFVGIGEETLSGTVQRIPLTS